MKRLYRIQADYVTGPKRDELLALTQAEKDELACNFMDEEEKGLLDGHDITRIDDLDEVKLKDIPELSVQDLFEIMMSSKVS